MRKAESSPSHALLGSLRKIENFLDEAAQGIEEVADDMLEFMPEGYYTERMPIEDARDALVLVFQKLDDYEQRRAGSGESGVRE